MDNDINADSFDEKARQQVEKIWKIQEATNLSMQETDRRMQETDRRIQETERILQQTLHGIAKTERELDKVGRQLGELGNKWGGFTEGMAYPSMVKVLTEQFQLDQFAPNLQSRRGGGVLEIDVLGYANGDINRACIVEVKSRLRERGIEQILRTLDNFNQFFPEHHGKTVYGILAAVSVPDDLARQVAKEGLFLARISDDTFQLKVADGFQARSWGRPEGQLLVRERAPVYQLSRS